MEEPDPRREQVLNDDEIALIGHRTWLESIHINAALTLLRRQFTDIGALFNVEWGVTLSFSKAGKRWIQIIHNGADHWMCAAQGFHTETQDVTVYDSLSAGTSSFKQEIHTINCIGCLGHSDGDQLMMLNMSCQRQDNEYDCGVYAIAFATALALGRNPSDIVFDARHLRSHLIHCFRNGKLSLFPVLERETLELREQRCEPPFVLALPLFCSCRRSDARLNGDWDMAKCQGQCAGWYHRMCASIPQEVFDEHAQWMCDPCIAGVHTLDQPKPDE